MAKSVVLTPATAQRVREIIANVPGASGAPSSSAGARQITYVLVTGPAVFGYYPCQPSAWDESAQKWTLYDEASVFGANGETLTEDSRYLAVRVGDDEDGGAVFVADALAGGGGGSVSLYTFDGGSTVINTYSPTSKLYIRPPASGGGGIYLYDLSGTFGAGAVGIEMDGFGYNHATTSYRKGVIGAGSNIPRFQQDVWFDGDASFSSGTRLQPGVDLTNYNSVLHSFDTDYAIAGSVGKRTERKYVTTGGTTSFDLAELEFNAADIANTTHTYVSQKWICGNYHIGARADNSGQPYFFVYDGLATHSGQTASVSGLTFKGGILTAGALSVAWGSITGTPTTLGGYGITDAQPLDTQLTSLAGLSYAGNGGKVVAVNGAENGFELIAATGTGTVTVVSVVTANGFAGTVATDTTTPAITLTTTITGLLKGNGTAISAAVADTDYATPGGVVAYAQPLDADLTAIAALATTAFGRGVLPLADAAALATYAGVGTGDSPQLAGINLGHASDTTLTRVSAGVVAVEGVNIVLAGAATTSGITMATARMLGRTTAGTGAIEEITVGSGLSLSAGSLTCTVSGVSDGDKGDITVSASGATWTIDPNAVTLGKMAALTGLSVIGHPASGSATPSAITAVTDGHALRLSGTTLGFGTLATGAYADGSVTAVKLGALNAFTDADPALGDVLPGYDTSAAANRDFRADDLLALCPPMPGGRLTTVTGNPYGQASSSTLYYTPAVHNVMVLWDGTRWRTVSFTEVSMALSALTINLPYDVFGYLSGGALAIEPLAWASANARATAISLQDGRYCKTGDKTRLYLGTFAPDTAATTKITAAYCGVWNMYHRVRVSLTITDTTNSWTYTTAAWRQVRATAANKVEYVVGLAIDSLDASAHNHASNSGGALHVGTGIGVNSTSVNSAPIRGGAAATGASNSGWAKWKGLGSAGYNYLAWLEYSSLATGTTTWYGDSGGVIFQTGLIADVMA